ncbi:MAG: LysR family transcriptional regulator, partial [Kangiellaceae bacterium]|nr:LysR family transcriptional regulator [Kangiellaceae bacterium]
MDIALLRTFLEVKKQRHFGRAAENLYLTQAAVSSRVKQLESILGVKLFTRIRNNLQLTAEGQTLAKYAEDILKSWQSAQLDINLTHKATQSFTIGGTGVFWELFLKAAIFQLYQQNANVVLNIESHDQNTLTRKLLEHNLDLAFVYEPVKTSVIKSTIVSEFDLVLVSSEPSIDFNDAIDTGYVHIDWGVSFDIFLNRELGKMINPAARTSQALIGLDLITQLGGNAYLPQALVKDQLGTQLYQVSNAPTFLKPVYAVELVNNDKAELAHSLLSQLGKTVEQSIENQLPLSSARR